METNESVKKIIRELGGAKGLYKNDVDCKRIVWKMARDLAEGKAADFREMASEDEEDFTVFYQYDSSGRVDEMKTKILEQLPDEDDYTTYTIVIMADSFEKKAEVKKYSRKIRNAIKKKMGCMPSQISLQVLHYYSGEEHSFVIDIGKRIDVIEVPDKTKKKRDLSSGAFANKITAYTYSARLYDIVEMYNKVGDSLFQKNVRYSINDQLEVEKSIKSTLRDNPENFWFLNNGITITVYKKSGLDISKNSRIILDYDPQKFSEVVSVINGAQTIATAAEFWYEDIGDKAENVDEIRETAKNQARVLLRVMCVNEDDIDCQAEMDQISVALNRQKPIKGEDIAYTSSFVIEINQLFKADEADDIHFYITKRGEQMFGKYQYSLTNFARALKAYSTQKPGEARTSSANKILAYLSQNVSPNYINAIRQEDAESAFLQYFKPVNFAMKALDYYRGAEKRIEQSRPYDTAILGNGGYYFLAYLVHVAHEDCSNYKDFSGKIENINENFDPVLCLYLDVLNELGEEYIKNTDKKTIDSNTFKNEELYQMLVTCKDAGYNAEVREKAGELEKKIREQLL